MKGIRKVSGNRSKAGNKTQISATLQDATDIPFTEHHQGSLQVGSINTKKKVNYFNLKINSKLSVNPNLGKFNMHQRHYSVNQKDTKVLNTTAQPQTYSLLCI